MDTLFTHLFPNRKLTRAQIKQIEIVKGAIPFFAQNGLGNTNLGDVAEAIKISRPLIQHHFGGKAELILLCARYVRLRFQEYVVARLPDEAGAEAIEQYCRACFSWARDCRGEGVFWAKFMSTGITNANFRLLNEEVAAMGRERILSLIEYPSSKKKEAKDAALSIQTLITGALFVHFTDSNLSLTRLERLTLNTVKLTFDSLANFQRK